MNNPIELPAYSEEDLAGLSPSELTDILIENLDRAPRNVIDACARSGDEMTAHLRQLHEDDFLWLDNKDEPDEIAEGIWWLRHHAAMILGQIPSEQAGLLLVELMRRMSLEDDDDLQDWRRLLARILSEQTGNRTAQPDRPLRRQGHGLVYPRHGH